MIAFKEYIFCSHSHASSYTVRLGTNKRNGYDDNAVEMTLDEFFIHPSYNRYDFTYDIALLKITGGITMTDYIRPVCLPKPREAFYSSDECYTTGWGRVSKLYCSQYITSNVSLY